MFFVRPFYTKFQICFLEWQAASGPPHPSPRYTEILPSRTVNLWLPIACPSWVLGLPLISESSQHYKVFGTHSAYVLGPILTSFCGWHQLYVYLCQYWKLRASPCLFFIAFTSQTLTHRQTHVYCTFWNSTLVPSSTEFWVTLFCTPYLLSLTVYNYDF